MEVSKTFFVIVMLGSWFFGLAVGAITVTIIAMKIKCIKIIEEREK